LQNARCLVKVKFSPKDSRIYEAKVPLFLGGNTAQPYYLVDVRGEGQYPRLKFDTKECIMPPVPLGFTSRAQFYVISQGYDNLQLKVYNTPSYTTTTTSSHIAEVIALQHHIAILCHWRGTVCLVKAQWKLTIAWPTFLHACNPPAYLTLAVNSM